jgi:secreted Zn-dependent insulinase-like peptidase
MNIKVNGFRDSFTKFMDQYVSRILDFVPVDTALFETLKEKQVKNYSNALLGNPYQLAYDSLLSSLR